MQFPRDSQGCRGALREPKVIPQGVQAFGVQAVNAKDLVQMVYQTTKMKATCSLESFLPALRASLEDFILQSSGSVRKAEEEVSIQKRSTLDITAVQPELELVIALTSGSSPHKDYQTFPLLSYLILS